MKLTKTALIFLVVEFSYCQTLSHNQPKCVDCAEAQRYRMSKQAFEEQKLEIEKMKILRKLGLTEPPDVSVEEVKPQKQFFIQRSMDTVGQSEEPDLVDDDDTAETKRILIEGVTIQDLSLCNEIVCFEFDLPHDFPSQRLANVTLWHYVGTATSNPSIEVSEIYSKLITPDTSETTAEGWVDLNMTEHVKSWQTRRHQKSKHRKLLQIKCLNCIDEPSRSDDNNLPFLEIFTEPHQKKRRRRSDETECYPGTYNNCCLQRYWVNFTAIKWNDWVIMPHGYWANYCSGNCRYGNTGVHRSVLEKVVQNKEMNGKDFDKDMIPCCAPKGEMGTINMIYMLNSSHVNQKELKNMVVQSCGC